MSTYPGNPSLGDEVKQRIVATFEQSVDLAERGRNQEAILGCDFVLELDPEFAPARALKDRLTAPAGESADELFDLDSPAPREPPRAAPEPEPAAPQASPACDGLEASLRERLAARDFQGVLEHAAREGELIAANPELARMAQIAQARIEAQPYVESFLREAGTALRTGDRARAETVLEKVRSLDPDHPLLENLEAAARQADGDGAAAPAAAAPPPSPEAAGAPGEDLDIDDEDLLGGFDLPDLDLAETPAWEDEGAAAPEPDEDLFSLDALDLEAPPDTAPAAGTEPSAAPSPEPSTAPAAPAPAPAPPAAEAPSRGAAPAAEGDDRIAELLAEGQTAADAGDYQGAIDAWSRIFLIDVDHAEAGRKIEEARRLKAERERKTEEVFHEGLRAIEDGDQGRARERFEQVLQMQPNHLAARDYLRQIDSGEPVKVPAGPSPDETVAMGSLGTFDLSDLAGSRKVDDELREEILVPPPPSAKGGDGEAGADVTELPGYGPGTAAKREPGRRSFLLVGGLVLFLVVLAGWWLFDNKDRFFPNSDAEEAVAGAPDAAAEGTPGTIERAVDLHERGQTAMALGLLKRIRPDNPRYSEAQELVARWEEPAATEPGPGEPSMPAEALARRERLVSAAVAAYGQREHLLAAELYDRAEKIAPLEGEEMRRREAIDDELAPIHDEVVLFREGEYEIVLPRLWRLYEENPSNRDVRRMLVDSYYNRGVRELQRGDAAAAADELEEALMIAPDDPDLQRHFLFAQTYQRRAKDLLYRIYVKYLPLR